MYAWHSACPDELLGVVSEVTAGWDPDSTVEVRISPATETPTSPIVLRVPHPFSSALLAGEKVCFRNRKALLLRVESEEPIAALSDLLGAKVYSNHV